MRAEAPSDAELVRVYLAGHDAACPRCGYNLRGALGDHCPECGRELRLAIEGATRRSGAFYAGLFGLAMAAAGCGVLVLTGIFTMDARLIVGPLGLGIVWLQFRQWTADADEIDNLPYWKKQERVSLCWLWAAMSLFLVGLFLTRW